MQNVYAKSYKEDKSNTTVNGVFVVTFKDNTDVVESVRLAFGGIGATPLLATKAQEYMVDK